MLESHPRELEEIAEMLSDDARHDVEIESSVIVHGDIAKADHLHHPLGQLGTQQTRIAQQFKRVA